MLLQCERFISGMSKLVEAGEQLAVLNEKLAAQRVAVVEKTASCDALLDEITAATARTEDKKTLAVDKGKEAEDQSKDIEMEKVQLDNQFYLLLTETDIETEMIIAYRCSVGTDSLSPAVCEIFGPNTY